LQLELQLAEGVDSVYSLFALRDAPTANGDAPLVVADTSKGLTPELAARIRAHPVIGNKLLSADGKAMVFIATPAEQKAPLASARVLNAEIQATADKALKDTGATATATGFPAIRIGIVDLLKRDQLVLNGIGAIIGFVISLIAFRSVVGATLTAVPAIIAGLTVLGGMGLVGAKVSVMTTVIPALVMILGYADGMHLSHAWRKHRDAGKSPLEAEWLAQKEAGAACMLTALTVAAAFASLAITDISIVKSFAWVGAGAMLVACPMMLIGHALGTLLIGRFWKGGRRASLDLLDRTEGPCAALGRFVVGHARGLALISAALFFVFGAMYWAVPPEHSLREHLPAKNIANAALGRYDAAFGGAFPLQVIVPGQAGVAPTSPEGLARIGAVHKAVAGVAGAGTPLSLWSLVEWLGGSADAATAKRLDAFLADVSPETRSRFVAPSGAALVSSNVQEQPVHILEPVMEKIEAAARAAGGNGVALTGVTVVTTREAARTIDDLNWSLATAVFGDIFLLILAFRNIPIGVVSSLANTLPLFATGALLYLSGRGMQFTSVIALTVAFGIAVDDTVHYINRLLVLHGPDTPLDKRIVETSREVGPVLIGTTIIILFGLSTTFTSGLPTVTLFGVIAGITLVVAMAGDLIVMPSLIAGYGRRWFEPKNVPTGATAEARSEA
jgi:predicted RND superfamily exporter protein